MATTWWFVVLAQFVIRRVRIPVQPGTGTGDFGMCQCMHSLGVLCCAVHERCSTLCCPGALFNLLLQVILNGSQSMHAVSEAGVSVTSADGVESLQIKTWDASLVSPGKPTVFPNGVFAPCMDQGMHFNLVNNVWGTNYVSGPRGELCSRQVAGVQDVQQYSAESDNTEVACADLLRRALSGRRRACLVQ